MVCLPRKTFSISKVPILVTTHIFYVTAGTWQYKFRLACNPWNSQKASTLKCHHEELREILGKFWKARATICRRCYQCIKLVVVLNRTSGWLNTGRTLPQLIEVSTTKPCHILSSSGTAIWHFGKDLGEGKKKQFGTMISTFKAVLSIPLSVNL